MPPCLQPSASQPQPPVAVASTTPESSSEPNATSKTATAQSTTSQTLLEFNRVLV